VADFAESGADVMMDNGQTRMLAGVLYDIPYGQCTAETLAEAKNHLRQLALVGLTEAFDQSLWLMSRLFGWRFIHYTVQNVSARRPPLDEATRQALTAVNRLDQELYRYGRELLAEQWSLQGDDEALARFQRWNRRLRPLIHYGGELWYRLRQWRS
jgi:hypothetical protein